MIKLLVFCTYMSLCVGGLNAVLFDCYTGERANKTQLEIYTRRNNTVYCIVDIKPCDPKEWRRMDGSCHNLKYPTRGVRCSPFARLLPPDFSPNYEPRKAANGGELPLTRQLRTELLHMGKASDLSITQLVSHYILFSVTDVISNHDTINYVRNLTTCCTPEGRKDYRCISIKVPVDDPVHRYSGVSCMNLTRPVTFQSYGCVNTGTPYARYQFQTPVFDLSQIYNAHTGFIDRLRTFKNGLLKIEEENGLVFPPSNPDSDYCFLNQPPRETRCHKYHLNTIIGPAVFTILFYRQHNQIAEELRRLNPCWDDERLFFTARDINIAISMQIYLYELLPIVMGRRNLIRDGILSCDGGFRDPHDENVLPQMSDEYIYVKRWFHTIQETNLKFYDKNGCFVKTFPLVNGTTRTGFLALDDNMLQIIQGSFRQANGKFDTTIDYDMADRVLGGMLLSSDVATSDLRKGRFFGFQPYIKYREFCTKKSYKSFSDLEEVFGAEQTCRLRKMYKNVNNIELMSAIWLEKYIKGGWVPETVYCLMVEQLKRTIASDRHWYERPNRPYAFTADQLKAMRKVTIAGLLCTVGNFVTEIQPRAFYSISSKNPLTKCSSSKIGKLDLAPWKDSNCKKGKE